jgi:hypothetical protein
MRGRWFHRSLRFAPAICSWLERSAAFLYVVRITQSTPDGIFLVAEPDGIFLVAEPDGIFLVAE